MQRSIKKYGMNTVDLFHGEYCLTSINNKILQYLLLKTSSVEGTLWLLFALDFYFLGSIS